MVHVIEGKVYSLQVKSYLGGNSFWEQILRFAVAETRKRNFWNRSSDKRVYIIELNLVSFFFFFFFFFYQTEFLPGTMKISQKVSKMGNIARNL